MTLPSDPVPEWVGEPQRRICGPDLPCVDCDVPGCQCPACIAAIDAARVTLRAVVNAMSARMTAWRKEHKPGSTDLPDRPAAAWSPEERLDRAMRALEVYKDHLKRRGEEVTF
jgi:hypothetical protein